MSAKKVNKKHVIVSPVKGKAKDWKVSTAKSKKAIVTTKSKKVAVKKAVKIAKAKKGTLTIQSRTGKIQEGRNYKKPAKKSNKK